MNKKNVLSVKNLNKIYNSKNSNSINALKNLNLDVKEGEIFGLLGPNGAGKTTFINILAGTVIKTSGEVNVWGFNLDKNPRQVRASIGIVPDPQNGSYKGTLPSQPEYLMIAAAKVSIIGASTDSLR